MTQLKRICICLVALWLMSCSSRSNAQWSQPVLIAIDSSSNPHLVPRIALTDTAIAISATVGQTILSSLPTDIFIATRNLAQQGQTWTPFVNISRTNTPSFFQVLRADKNGALHLFWLEQLWRRAITPGDTISIKASAIFYSTNETGVWSSPVEIFSLDSTSATSQTDRIGGEYDAKIDEKNTIHVTFSAATDIRGAFIYYTKRQNGRWVTPIRLQIGNSSAIAISQSGKIHIALIDANLNFENNIPIPDANSVFAISSNDNGATWSSRTLVSLSGRQPANFPVMLADRQNRVHILWLKAYSFHPFPDAVWHSYSSDGGTTWSLPDTAVVATSGRKILFMRATIDSTERIHLATHAFFGSGRFRLYYVTQRNQRWLPPIEIRTEQIGLDCDIAVDKQGRVYIVFPDRGFNPRGLYVTSSTIGTSSAPELSNDKPQSFQLFQNYPNPFNPTTTISYQLPENSSVSLKVFDMLGREVQTLVNTRQAAGRYDVPFNAASLSSGTYFYRLQAGTFVETKKMLLVK